jgi:hypothetical protein
MNARLARVICLHLFLLLCISLPAILSQDLAINEMMASNATTIHDEDGDFEDWIELYNYGSLPVDLEGFGLSDDNDSPFKWVFPATVLNPGDLILVWASGKDRTGTGSPLHTNFSISSDGEELILTSPDDIRIDEIPPIPVPTDISYGRFPDGTGDLYFFSQPTPGQVNDTETWSGILEKISFSHDPGFYTGDFSLELSHADNDAVIYYSLDGSVPDVNSLQYTSAIAITDRSEEENQHSEIPTTSVLPPEWRGWKPPDGKVAKSTIIRATAVKPGFLSSPAGSATYFVFPNGRERYTMDVVSIITEHDHLFSDATGIYVPGDSYEGSHRTGNYHNRGEEWERPASIEFFADELYFQQDIGIRIHGGWTRRDPIKSLRLYARSEYGESRFNYRIFPDLPYTSYNRLLLRQSGNDWAVTMFRDAAAQSLASHLDLDTQAYRPTVIFLNGEYWGIKNLRERYDRHYLERVYGVDPGNIDLLTGQNIVIEGDNTHYNQMVDFIDQNDLGNDVYFSQVLEMMDINNFLDYYSTQIYYQNTDWPSHNIDFWRLRVEYNGYAPKGHDGRWRWLLYDVDRALGLFPTSWDYTFNMMEYLTSRLDPEGREWPNLLLRNLLENETFKNSIINRIADHLNTAFLPARVNPVIDSFSIRVEPEIEEFIRRWGYPGSKNEWRTLVQRMHTNAGNRPSYVRQHVMDHFGIPGMADVTVAVNSPEGGYIRINSIDITPSTPGVEADPYPWTGGYFQGIPVEIEAVHNQGYTFSHWTGTGIGDGNQNNRVLGITPVTDISLEAHFTFAGAPELISYWFFGTGLPNDTPLETIAPIYSKADNAMIIFRSALEGYPFTEDHPNWRLASMERRNAPTDINYHPGANNNIAFEDSGMRGIQVTQPLAENGNESAMIFHVPTPGHEGIVFNFAAMDEGAAQSLIIDYSLTGGEPAWTDAGLENNILGLTGSYQLYQADLSALDQADNNPDLKIRIRFYAPDMSVSEGNRVTFNNFSLHGIPMDELIFYSKPEGSLSELQTWGSEPDGSGDPPESFGLHTAKFFIHNRESIVLDSDWEVTGAGSRVILGDDVSAASLRVNAGLHAMVDVMTNATLELSGPAVPDLGNLRDASTVILSGEASTLPYASFYNLVLDNIDPVFHGNGIIQIRGDLRLEGTVQMPDSRDEHEYDLVFTGNHDQLISGNGNVVRGYNVVFDKAGGLVSFSGDNGGTSLSSDNQLRLVMAAEANFEDNGITIYAGNSVNIDGDPESYNFSGTLVLAGYQEGIVRGAGQDNNFNIRDSNRNNTNVVAALNNVIIRADNTDGEFRFRDGSSNQFIIKGDFIVESGASGRLQFYGNDVHAGGDFVIQQGFTGSIETISRIIFDGSGSQVLSTGDIIRTDNLTIANPDNIMLEGMLRIDGSLHFDNGKIHVSESGLPLLGPDALISGHDEQRFVEGLLGIYLNNTQQREVIFPIGKEGIYSPLELVIAHENTDENLYIAEWFPVAPPDLVLPDQFVQVFGDFYYDLYVQGDPVISEAFVTLTYNPDDITIDQDLLRIAKSRGNSWVTLGGEAEAGRISSTIPFTTPGIFALAEQDPAVSVTDPSIEDNSGIRIFPNPVNDILWLEFAPHIKDVAVMSVVSMNGTTIMEKILVPADNSTMSVNLGDLEPGMYIVKINCGQIRVSRAVIIL